MTVLDTSAVVDFLLGAESFDAVEAILTRDAPVAAPDLLVFETLAVLRRLAAREPGIADRAAGAVEDLADLPLVLYPAMALRKRAWELRTNFTAADALFVALAEALGEPFVTRDSGLAAAVRRHTSIAVVELGG